MSERIVPFSSIERLLACVNFCFSLFLQQGQSGLHLEILLHAPQKFSDCSLSFRLQPFRQCLARVHTGLPYKLPSRVDNIAVTSIISPGQLRSHNHFVYYSQSQAGPYGLISKGWSLLYLHASVYTTSNAFPIIFYFRLNLPVSNSRISYLVRF